MLKYSFVLPAYKGNFLKETIDSILMQSYKNFELIIVDDASPDDIDKIVAEYNDVRIKYHRNSSNIGGRDLVAQWNKCLPYAQGEWVILATDDDLYNSEFLAAIDNGLTRHPEVDLYRARICHCDKQMHIEIIENGMPDIVSQEEFMHRMQTDLLGGIPQYVFRREKLLSIGGFYQCPMAYGTDGVTPCLLAANGVATSAQVLVYFRNSGINISSIGRYSHEKIVARFMSFATMYSYIRSSFATDDTIRGYYGRKVLSSFAHWAKMDILTHLYMLPFYQRKQYLEWIMKKTPYLTPKQKYAMCYRTFVRK